MCAEASPETLRFAALKRSADASLVGSAYAPPDSASLRNAKLTEEEIQELDFGGRTYLFQKRITR